MGGTSHYFDKSNMAKLEGSLIVWIRHERIDDKII